MRIPLNRIEMTISWMPRMWADDDNAVMCRSLIRRKWSEFNLSVACVRLRMAKYCESIWDHTHTCAQCECVWILKCRIRSFATLINSVIKMAFIPCYGITTNYVFTLRPLRYPSHIVIYGVRTKILCRPMHVCVCVQGERWHVHGNTQSVTVWCNG